MSLVSDRIGYLMRSYSASEIAEITNISLSSISPSIGELEPLDKNIRHNIYLFYNRTVYKDLREVGATATEARRYRNKSVTLVLARLGQRSELINDLAEKRFEKYKAYLQKKGRYLNDDDTLATLRQSIAQAMGRSRKPPSKFDYDSYGTAQNEVLDDNY